MVKARCSPPGHFRMVCGGGSSSQRPGLLLSPWFFFSSRRRHTRFDCDWSSDVCSSDLEPCLCGREEDDPAGVSEHEGGMHVLMVEGVLQGEDAGVMARDQLGDLLVKCMQAPRQGVSAGQPNKPALDQPPTYPPDVTRFSISVAAADRSRGAPQHPHAMPSPP